MKKTVFFLLLVLAVSSALQSQISVIGTLTRYREALAGEEYDGTISLKNTGNQTAQARVYLRDYSFSADGTSSYPEPGSLERSNAQWIRLSSTTAVLGPGEIAEIRYTVDVPASDSLIGTYWSMIMVEGIPEETEREETDELRISIREVMRYGIQIVSDFTEDAQASLVFSNTRMVTPEEGRSFSVDLINNGISLLNGEIYLELFTVEGRHHRTVAGKQFRTFPGTSVRREFPLAGLSPGTYKALLVADCGGDNLFGGNYNLVIRD